MNLIQRIEKGAKELESELTSAQVEQLATYLEQLDKWNKAYNLSGIKQLDEMIAKHVFDSLAVIPYLKGETILDVGTGAGIPGAILAIACPDKHFTMLDSNGKKIRFLKQVIYDLGLKNATAIHGRIQDCTDQFDIVTSRAFTALDNMLELCRHTVKKDGFLLCMKGPGAIDEMAPIKNQVSELELIELVVPELDSIRSLVKFRLPKAISV